MKNSDRRRAVVSMAMAVWALALSGCAGFAKLPPSSDFGTPPVTTEAAVRAHFEAVLKDPESARYRFGAIRKAYANNGLIHGGGIAWHGYMQEVEVNAKNSYGGYVGFKPYMVFFQRDSNAVFRSYEGRTHVLVNFVD